jgi:hypothetical protein
MPRQPDANINQENIQTYKNGMLNTVSVTVLMMGSIKTIPIKGMPNPINTLNIQHLISSATFRTTARMFAQNPNGRGARMRMATPWQSMIRAIPRRRKSRTVFAASLNNHSKANGIHDGDRGWQPGRDFRKPPGEPHALIAIFFCLKYKLFSLRLRNNEFHGLAPMVHQCSKYG